METTVQTGAEKAADTLAQRLREAGWERVRVNLHDTQPPNFSDGKPMCTRMRQAAVHADGPGSLGSPFLSAYWHSDLPTKGHCWRPDRFEAEVYLGGATFKLTTIDQLGTWLDALLAVQAAVEA